MDPIEFLMKAAFAKICPILQSHTYLEERFYYPRFENMSRFAS
jgi:hypothetical protein